jgi:putative SOS response-associated peptidase YedK
VRLYRLTIKAPPHNLPPRYNICPTDPVDVVTERDGNRDFTRARWGLVPSWWPKPLKELKAATFNARAETVADKPFFREAFRRTRCLIPASGYYEWQDSRDHEKSTSGGWKGKERPFYRAEPSASRAKTVQSNSGPLSLMSLARSSPSRRSTIPPMKSPLRICA